MFIALLLPSLIAKFDLQRLVLFTHVIHVKIYVWLYYNESYDVDIAILVLVSCIIIINISFITLIIMSSFKHAQVLLTKRSSGGGKEMPAISYRWCSGLMLGWYITVLLNCSQEQRIVRSTMVSATAHLFRNNHKSRIAPHFFSFPLFSWGFIHTKYISLTQNQ